jgi:hypothetical protein
MGTHITLAANDGTDSAPSWRLYDEVFETGVVYLELRGVGVEVQTLETGGAAVVLRLPVATAEQLGLHTVVPPDGWERACDMNKW